MASPPRLADILIELNAEYAQLSDEIMNLVIKKSDFWLAHKKIDSAKPVSDPTVKMMWLGTQEGKDLLFKEAKLKGIEKIMSNVKSVLRQREIEVRSLM